jgi:hypothetical protein
MAYNLDERSSHTQDKLHALGRLQHVLHRKRLRRCWSAWEQAKRLHRMSLNTRRRCIQRLSRAILLAWKCQYQQQRHRKASYLRGHRWRRRGQCRRCFRAWKAEAVSARENSQVACIRGVEATEGRAKMLVKATFGEWCDISRERRAEGRARVAERERELGAMWALWRLVVAKRRSATSFVDRTDLLRTFSLVQISACL